VAGPLDDEVRRVRMLPFAQACEGLERMGRDLAQAAGKEVEIRLEGGAVEMDRSILEELKDPLRHLVRNGVDHGLEPSEHRRAEGKSPRGRITVAAALRGAQVEVTVRDDGRGLDLNALREQARRRGLESAGPDDLAQLIFLPGVSTAPIITDVSGRGVGLDVVKSRVEGLHGTVHVVFQAGQGTSFILTVPLTLTTLRAVLVKAGGRTYAFAGTNVHSLLRVNKTDIRSVSGRATLTRGGPALPLASLTTVLDQQISAPDWPTSKIPVAIIEAGERRLALAVDEFVAEQEILIKSLGPRLRRLPLISGATLLASGRVALVLNAANLIRAALQRPARTPVASAGNTAVARKRLLVAEDSATTRTLMKSILETAGYEVVTAVDGRAAWQLLGDQKFDLVVSDVEMPHTDGFALTEMIRANPRVRDLPVVLVTARESDADKARGIAVGANAYLLKSAFDQSSLLQAISQLL
jgi:two-component system chemotaxis sensor kinase CheA